MNELTKYIEPATIILVVVFVLQKLSPIIKSIYIEKRTNNLLNAAKRIVVYVLSQSDIKENQRRRVAGKMLAEWLIKHNIQMGEDEITSYIEYAYKLLDGGGVI